MPLTITTGPTEKGPTMISPERYYVTADRSKVVREGDPRAAFLLVGKGCEIDVETAKRYGITEAHVTPVVAVTRVTPAPAVTPKPAAKPEASKADAPKSESPPKDVA